MLVAVLVVLNIPVYLLVGWLVFDTKENAADTFFETIVAILKSIFIPKFLSVMTGTDDDGSSGIVPLFACGGIVYGQYYLITKFFG